LVSQQPNRKKWTGQKDPCTSCGKEGIMFLCNHAACVECYRNLVFNQKFGGKVLTMEFDPEGCHIYKCPITKCTHFLLEEEIKQLIGVHYDHFTGQAIQRRT